MSQYPDTSICLLRQLPFCEVHDAIREIFFLSSRRQEFSSPSDKEAFFSRWTSAYFTGFSDYIWVAHKNNKLVGYLMGCPQSRDLLAHNVIHLPSYLVFEDQFDRFPAHLHMNTHPDFRSQGWGSLLLARFLVQLKETSCRGVHIVTSPTEPNTHFYKRNLFEVEIERRFNHFELLFMGRHL